MRWVRLLSPGLNAGDKGLLQPACETVAPAPEEYPSVSARCICVVLLVLSPKRNNTQCLAEACLQKKKRCLAGAVQPSSRVWQALRSPSPSASSIAGNPCGRRCVLQTFGWCVQGKPEVLPNLPFRVALLVSFKSNPALPESTSVSATRS